MKVKYQTAEGKIDSKRMRELFELLSKAKRNFKFPTDYSSKPLSQQLYQEYNDLMLSKTLLILTIFYYMPTEYCLKSLQ
jgi:hypothetical protein